MATLELEKNRALRRSVLMAASLGFNVTECQIEHHDEIANIVRTTCSFGSQDPRSTGA